MVKVPRRKAIGIFAVSAAGAVSVPVGAARPEGGAAHAGGFSEDSPDWLAWKAAFLAPEGRVVDRLQGDASHSEGQGYGLFLAAAHGDAAAFEAIRTWTERFLAVRQDPLLAWLWRPGDRPPISDYNNATDGDLFYAWGLLRGAHRFGRVNVLDRARQISEFLATSAVVADPRGGNGRLLLLPSLDGAWTDSGVMVNPSYYMPLALRELAALTGREELWAVAQDGVALITEIARKGPVPNWLEVGSGGWRPSPRHPAVSGYDALRIPLWLAWSGAAKDLGRPACLDVSVTDVPTVVDLATGAVNETSSSAGYRAVAAIACGAPDLPLYSAEQSYFPASLHLLAQIARAEASSSSQRK